MMSKTLLSAGTPAAPANPPANPDAQFLAAVEEIGEAGQQIAEAINNGLTSDRLHSRPVSLLEVLDVLAEATLRVGKAIDIDTEIGATDATGGNVRSLSEAVMGVTAGLVRIADSVNNLAEAVREHK
jgi:hypothetical protein